MFPGQGRHFPQRLWDPSLTLPRTPSVGVVFLFVNAHIRASALPPFRPRLNATLFLTAPAWDWHPQAGHRQDADEHEPADLHTRRPLPGEQPGLVGLPSTGFHQRGASGAPVLWPEKVAWVGTCVRASRVWHVQAWMARGPAWQPVDPTG